MMGLYTFAAVRTTEEILFNELDKTFSTPLVKGMQVSAFCGPTSIDYAKGDLEHGTPIFIASTTKLFVTSLILQAADENHLTLEDKITCHLTDKVIIGLNTFNGVDLSKEITIIQLLSHTSGIADYFEEKDELQRSWKEEVTNNTNHSWNFEKAIKRAKSLQSYFPPGKRGKTHYSDTNFQLLGKILENIYDSTLDNIILDKICTPLGLKSTYMYCNSSDRNPQDIYYGSVPLNIPASMASFQADGGMVSNSKDMMVFLKAFFNGQLFPKSRLQSLYQWNRILTFPMEYGVGLMRFKLPRLLSPLKPIPELIGHSGLSGAFAFYSPEKEFYCTGTLNQLKQPDMSFKMLSRILGKLP